jgi:hypothetical protein
MHNEPPITKNNDDLRNYIYEVLSDLGLTRGIVSAADFHAQMPGDNAATIAAGAPVNFPNDGAIVGTDITRLSANTFNLVSPGKYQVFFQVSVDEAGQLMAKLNGAEIITSCSGRATGTNQIVGMVIVDVVLPNSTFQIVNPLGNATALTITPIAGGAHTVSAHLVITRLS